MVVSHLHCKWVEVPLAIKNKIEDEQTLSLSISFDDPILQNTSKSIDIKQLKSAYSDPAPNGKRIAPRYLIELEVIILTHTKSFRTKSINISITGALLHEVLPKEFMSVPLEIIFIKKGNNGKRRLLFRGKAVGGPKQSPRITFQSSTLNSEAELLEELRGLEPLPFVS